MTVMWELAVPPGMPVQVRPDPALGAPTLTALLVTATTAATAAVAAAGVTWPADVEVMLGRFEANGKTSKWPHRKVAEQIADAGFTPHVPTTGDKPYVRWTYDAPGVSATVYQEGGATVVDSHRLLPHALGLPGGTPPAGKHPKVTWRYADSLEDAAAVPDRLRKALEA